MADEFDLRPYLGVIYRRRYLVGAVVAGSLLAAAMVSFVIARPTYEASALLRLVPALVPGGSAGIFASSADELISRVNNRTVAASAARRVPSSPAVTPETVLRKVRFAPVRPDLLQVSVRDASPADAAAIARAWALAIVEFARSQNSRQLRQAQASLDGIVKVARAAAAEAEKSVSAYEAASRIPLLREEVRESASRIAFYEAELGELSRAGGATVGRVWRLRNDGTVAALGPRDAAQLQTLIAVHKARLARDQATLAAEQSREEMLMRRADLARSAYTRLAEQVAQLGALAEQGDSPVVVETPPTPPTAPVTPGRTRTFAVAAFLGLVLGSLLAFLMEQASGHSATVASRGTFEVRSP